MYSVEITQILYIYVTYSTIYTRTEETGLRDAREVRHPPEPARPPWPTSVSEGGMATTEERHCGELRGLGVRGTDPVGFTFISTIYGLGLWAGIYSP